MSLVSVSSSRALETLTKDIWNLVVDKSLRPRNSRLDSLSPLEILLRLVDKILDEIDLIVAACCCLQEDDAEDLLNVPCQGATISVPYRLIGLPSSSSGSSSLKGKVVRVKDVSRVPDRYRKYISRRQDDLKDEEVKKEEVEDILIKPDVDDVEEEDEEEDLFMKYDCDEYRKNSEEEDEEDEDDDEYSFRLRKPKFPCNICGKKMSNKKSLRTHMSTHASSKDLECGSCGKSFAAKEYLRAHIRRAHRDPEIEGGHGSGLEETMTTAAAATTTKTNSASEVPSTFDCFFCDFSGSSDRDRLAHEREHEGPLQCEECGKSYADKEKYKRHQRNLHAKTESICDWCGAGFRNVIYLREHVRNMHSEVHVLCKDCGVQVKRSAYRGHRERKHPTAPTQRTQCEYCEKTFRSKKTLRVHQACVHGKGDRAVLNCSQCPRKFISEFHLKEHVRTHLGIKLTCSSCAKQFSHKQSLMKHVRNENCGGGGELTVAEDLSSVTSLAAMPASAADASSSGTATGFMEEEFT